MFRLGCETNETTDLKMEMNGHIERLITHVRAPSEIQTKQRHIARVTRILYRESGMCVDIFDSMDFVCTL